MRISNKARGIAMETTVLMIRHAESPFIFGKERTRGLSKKGKEDASAITTVLHSFNIDVIVSSPYTRAIQTIQGLADDHMLEIHIIEGLREKQLKGAYQLPTEEIDEAIKKSFQDLDYCLEGGESSRNVQNRAIPEIIHLLEKYAGQTIVICTHGNIMAIIFHYFDTRYGYDFWKNTSKPDIYQLIFEGVQLNTVQRLNEENTFCKFPL